MAYSTNYTASSGWADGVTQSHADHVSDLYAELGSNPSGADADLTTRLTTMVESDTAAVGQPATAITNVVAMTAANYALITPDANTLYVING